MRWHRLAVMAAVASTRIAAAQEHAMMGPQGTSAVSQAAFSTISEVVRKLKADPSTDWSKVNLEALRQHLIDMDHVVMRAVVKQSNVEGGVSLDVTGAGDVAGAIRRMLTMHAMALNEEGAYSAKATEIPAGARLVVTAKGAGDSKTVALLRGLGFAGIITESDHHAMHHLVLARGDAMVHKHP